MRWEDERWVRLYTRDTVNWKLLPWQSKCTDALMDEAQDPFAGAEVLYAYTRKQALADGVQADVSEMAREAGLKFPVYLTGAVWENYVRVPDGVRCQDEQGRLWDVVWMLRCAARRTNGPQMRFKLHVRNDNRDRTPPLVTLQAVCGPRDIDDPASGITIMLPDEDGRAHRPDDLRQRAMCGPAR